MRDKALNLLGLMRKANAAQIGETDTGAAVRANAARLVVLASDASDNARSRAKGFVYGRNVPLIVSPFTKDEISSHVGKNGCSMLAICDTGFADAFMRCLTAIDEDKYSECAARVAEVLDREKQRKRENEAHERNKRTGKRRNNA